MDDLLVLVVEPPSTTWRFKMRVQHNIPSWTFPYFTDRFNDRFRNYELKNDIENFRHYSQSTGHRKFMKFWVDKTKDVFNWSNYLSWGIKSDVDVQGLNSDKLCVICKRECRQCPSERQWRDR